jgi:hypothetical protein
VIYTLIETLTGTCGAGDETGAISYVEWIKPLDSADYLGPREETYHEPLFVMDDRKRIDRNRPGPSADKLPALGPKRS